MLKQVGTKKFQRFQLTPIKNKPRVFASFPVQDTNTQDSWNSNINNIVDVNFTNHNQDVLYKV